jgi:hypothetical protein
MSDRRHYCIVCGYSTDQWCLEKTIAGGACAADRLLVAACVIGYDGEVKRAAV